jgi:serine/threonine protein kinase
MKADRWQKIEQVFHAALQRKPEERADFLKTTCAGDRALYGDVQALLATNQQDDSFFEHSASALAAEMFTDRVGETIGPYEVLSELGSGAMGIVYLAQDVRLGRKIAIKILPSQFTNDRDRLRRFQQEARAASALNHPNILTVHEIEQKDGLHYIATEFVDGVTLRQHMANRRMSLDEVLNVATQIAGALQAAHAAGIAHRDIKPENVMIRSDGYIKVLDFGLAKLTEQEFSPATPETNPGVVMGTPRYMSPEQARGLDVDPRTDIFSLGTLVYEMVTGKVPFEGETTSDIIAALIKDEPELMSATVPEVPLEFEEVVKKALAKDVALRYQTIADFLADLQQLKDEIKLNALERTNSDGSRLSLADNLQTTTPVRFRRTDPEAKQRTEPVAKKISIGWLIPVTVGLVLVAGIVVVLYLNRRNTPSSLRLTQASRQLTNRDGFISASRFAPDGKSIIYSAGFDGRPVELFITDVDGSNFRSFGIQSSAALKSVSRSGKVAVLFDFELNWSDGYNGTLAILPPDGGKPEIIGDGIDDAAFAPDGNTFAIIRSGLAQQQLEYPAGKVRYKSEGWMSYPRFSPKGDKIAFFEHPIGDASGSIIVLDLLSQEKIDISTDWKFLKGLAWHPSGNEIWYGGGKLYKHLSIHTVSLSGQLPMNVYDLPGMGARVEDISDDGKILINQGTNHSTMMVVEGKSKSNGIDSQFAWSTSADLSADGKTLLYYESGYESSDPSVENTSYLRRLDGSENIRLGPGKALALAPDGKSALALQTSPQPQLVILSTSGSEPRILPNRGMKEYHYATFFPDGRHILFTGVEVHKDALIRSYVQDINTGDVHPLTEEMTVALRVSPDGKSVITFQPDRTYYIQPLDGSQPTPIPGLESEDEPIQWSNDGRSVYVIGAGEFATKIYRVSLTTGDRREWKEIDPPNKVGLVGLETNRGGILITPDGKVSVYTYWILLQQLVTKSLN